MDTFFQQLINGLTIGAIYALIALGYTMVYGILQLINFAHGDVYMIGAFAGFFLARCARLRRRAVAASGLARGARRLDDRCGAWSASSIERFAYRPVRNYARMTTLITAIGVSLLLENLGGQCIFGATPRSFPQLLPNETYTLVWQMPPSRSRSS